MKLIAKMENIDAALAQSNAEMVIWDDAISALEKKLGEILAVEKEEEYEIPFYQGEGILCLIVQMDSVNKEVQQAKSGSKGKTAKCCKRWLW